MEFGCRGANGTIAQSRVEEDTRHVPGNARVLSTTVKTVKEMALGIEVVMSTLAQVRKEENIFFYHTVHYLHIVIFIWISCHRIVNCKTIFILRHISKVHVDCEALCTNKFS
jgi:hypothetical protein